MGATVALSCLSGSALLAASRPASGQDALAVSRLQALLALHESPEVMRDTIRLDPALERLEAGL